MVLVHVIWIDASHETGWMSLDDAKDSTLARVHTVGWLVKDSDEAVWLTSDYVERDDTVFGCAVIPRNMIVSVRVIHAHDKRRACDTPCHMRGGTEADGGEES